MEKTRKEEVLQSIGLDKKLRQCELFFIRDRRLQQSSTSRIVNGANRKED